MTVQRLRETEVRRRHRRVFCFHQRAQHYAGDDVTDPRLFGFVKHGGQLGGCYVVYRLGDRPLGNTAYSGYVKPHVVAEYRERAHLLRRGILVNAIHPGDSVIAQECRCRNICAQHELLNQPFCRAALTCSDLARHSVLAEQDLSLARVKLHCALFSCACVENAVQLLHERECAVYS